jgi:hypothetical protein
VAGHAGLWSRFLVALPDPLSVSWGACRVGVEVAVDDVADATFECPDGFFGGVAFCEFAVVERATGTVREADLSNGGDVERVVDRTVPASRQPMRRPLRIPRRLFDGRGAVVGSEAVLVGEPERITGVSDHVAATTSPTPKTSLRVVPDAATAAWIRALDVLR